MKYWEAEENYIMRSFVNNYNNQIKMNEEGRPCRTHENV
jgi:hypothetical protein